MTKLKGHVVLWWDMMQKDRVNNQLERNKNWKNMIMKIKEKYFPIDYQQIFYRQVHNLRQNETSTHEYIEEFFRLSL